MLACRFADKYSSVYSNYEIRIPQHRKFSLDEFFRGSISDSLVIIDEAYSVADSRQSSNRSNITLSACVFQSGKMRCDLVIVSQIFECVDIRVREMVSKLVQAERCRDGFMYSVYKRKRKPGIVFKKVKDIFTTNQKASQFYPLYDTYELVHSEEQEYAINPEAQRKKMLDIFKGDKHALTKDYIRFKLSENRIPCSSDAVNYVYYTLEGGGKKRK